MPTKPNSKDRKRMEKAIEVMKKSIAETRGDGKESPLVGALLVKPDDSEETAYRGELRESDHAEFALLERKNRATILDYSTLFVTLEPCAPGARNHPKLSCAERIVNARIQEVWVGIEDPDPMVDRKGIKFLQDHGVKVHMFDRDLQDSIRAENEEFIKQAIERRADVEEKASKTVTLSKLENPITNTDLNDFLPELLDRYRILINTPDGVDSEAFRRRLAQQGLLREEDGIWVPAGFGILLFGKSPRDVMPQAGLLGTIRYPDGKEDIQDFDGPILLAPEQAIQWVKDKQPNPIDRSEAKRKDVSKDFYTLVREGIINALIHRDYDIEGAKCQLDVAPDTITIKSPGMPIEPITLKQLQEFNAPMLSRNPILHYVFGKMELAEERGFGLGTMAKIAQNASLPLPRYSWKEPYLVLTLHRAVKGIEETLDTKTLELLGKSEREGLKWIATKELASTTEYSEAQGLERRAGSLHLKKLVELGLVEKVGAGRSTRYRFVR